MNADVIPSVARDPGGGVVPNSSHDAALAPRPLANARGAKWLRALIADVAAIGAALIFALHWIPLGFGSTVYPRNLAMACVVAAALLVDRWPFAAGALVGLAFADRFSEIVFLIPILVVARQRVRILLGAIV